MGGSDMKKVIDIEERVPAMRERRRRKTNRKFIFILTIFVIALLLILYFQSPLSRINKITVSGGELNQNALYEEQSGLTANGPLWGFSEKDVVKMLTAIESVKDVSISRKWMRDVEIEISEWDTIAYIEERGQYSLLLESGKIFTPESLFLEDEAPILNGFNNEKNRKRITTQLKKMDKDVYPLISEIISKGTKEEPDRIMVYMDDGFEVRALISTFAEKMEYYPEVTAQLHGYEKGVIDMEVGTYFTPFSEIYNPGKGADEVVEENE